MLLILNCIVVNVAKDRVQRYKYNIRYYVTFEIFIGLFIMMYSAFENFGSLCE